MICGMGALVVVVVMLFGVFVRFWPERDRISESDSSPEAVEREIERIGTEMADSPGVAGGSFALLALALVGTGLAIVGLTRPNMRKGQATAGLIICGSFLLCQCLGMLMQGMLAGGG